MAEGRSRENWQHTSAILALLYNCNRDPKKTRAAKPSDFNPFEAKSGGTIVIGKHNIEQLRKRFIGR